MKTPSPRTFGIAITGGLLLWAAFPPLNLWPLAWIAPAFWVYLIRLPDLPGRRPLRCIWLGGFVHWMLIMHWLCFPHWSAGVFGWPLLSFYLSLYVLLFAVLSRFAVHRLRVPVILAAPLVWTGLELARGYFATGFSLALLSHTQVSWITLLQFADVFGGYGISFVMVLVAACLARMLPLGKQTWSLWPGAPLVTSLVVVLAYGSIRLRQHETQDTHDDVARVALIQSCIDVSFEEDRSKETVDQSTDLSIDAVANYNDLDLIIWPESMFSYQVPMITRDDNLQVDAEVDRSVSMNETMFRNRVLNNTARHWQIVKEKHDARAVSPEESRSIEAPAFILCTERLHLINGHGRETTPFDHQRYNTALYVNEKGNIHSYYDKMHPVMFGEYVPLGSVFPWLYNLTPMGTGLSPGKSAAVFSVAGVKMAPNICFESTVPHLIRRQVNRLADQGAEPDVIVNLTNDGWFWGSAALDLHLCCNVFRAVENRKAVLVAANTGFSAWIDGDGRILAKGKRHSTDTIYAEVSPAKSSCLYRWSGDIPALACLVFCVLVAGMSLVSRKTEAAGIISHASAE